MRKNCQLPWSDCRRIDSGLVIKYDIEKATLYGYSWYIKARAKLKGKNI